MCLSTFLATPLPPPQFQERFPSYFQYCLEEEKAVDFTRRQMESNPHFNAFLTVKWTLINYKIQ